MFLAKAGCVLDSMGRTRLREEATWMNLVFPWLPPVVNSHEVEQSGLNEVDFHSLKDKHDGAITRAF